MNEILADYEHQAEPVIIAEEVVSATVTEINALPRQAPLDLILSIGKTVIDLFHGGDDTAWRSRWHKCISSREPRRHPGLEISASRLFRALAVYEFADHVGVSVMIDASRSYAVGGLVEKEEKLLTAAFSAS